MENDSLNFMNEYFAHYSLLGDTKPCKSLGCNHIICPLSAEINSSPISTLLTFKPQPAPTIDTEPQLITITLESEVMHFPYSTAQNFIATVNSLVSSYIYGISNNISSAFVPGALVVENNTLYLYSRYIMTTAEFLVFKNLLPNLLDYHNKVTFALSEDIYNHNHHSLLLSPPSVKTEMTLSSLITKLTFNNSNYSNANINFFLANHVRVNLSQYNLSRSLILLEQKKQHSKESIGRANTFIDISSAQNYANQLLIREIYSHNIEITGNFNIESVAVGQQTNYQLTGVQAILPSSVVSNNNHLSQFNRALRSQLSVL